MAQTLAGLPPELLCLITSEVSAFSISSLWFCGDRRLNRKLGPQGGVTRFALDTSSERFRPRWPMLVSEFSNLQHFSLILTPASLYTQELVSQLQAPTLKELVVDANLRFCASLADLFPKLEYLEFRRVNLTWMCQITNWNDHLPVTLRRVSLKGLFLSSPSMQSLCFTLASLPTLSSVTYDLAARTDPLSSARVLGDHSSNDSKGAIVPFSDSVEEITWRANDLSVGLSLPLGLKKLEFFDILSVTTPEPSIFDDISHWQSLLNLASLTHLAASSFQNLKVEALKCLPPSLLTFIFWRSSTNIQPFPITEELARSFPPNLTHLEGHLACTTKEMLQLPASLSNLKISLQLDPPGFSTAHMQGIMHLRAKHIGKLTAKLLPHHLKKLRLHSLEGEFCSSLPALLEKLYISDLTECDELCDVTRMPNSITDLRIGGIDTLRFDFLPTQVTKLRLTLDVVFVSHRWVNWSSFLPASLTDLTVSTRNPIPYGDSWLEYLPTSIRKLDLRYFVPTTKPVQDLGPNFCGFTLGCLKKVSPLVNDLSILLSQQLDGETFFNSLPASLTRFHINTHSYINVSAKSFQQLPPNLTELSFRSWYATRDSAEIEHQIAEKFGVRLLLGSKHASNR